MIRGIKAPHLLRKYLQRLPAVSRMQYTTMRTDIPPIALYAEAYYCKLVSSVSMRTSMVQLYGNAVHTLSRSLKQQLPRKPTI